MEKTPSGPSTFFCTYCQQTFPYTSKEYHDLNCYYKQISNMNRSYPLPLYPFPEESKNKKIQASYNFNDPHIQNNNMRPIQNNVIYHQQPSINPIEYPSLEEINPYINEQNLVNQYPVLENHNENVSQHRMIDEFVDITNEVERIKLEEEKERLEKRKNEIEKKEKRMSLLKRIGKIGAGIGLCGLAILGRSPGLAKVGAFLIADSGDDDDEEREQHYSQTYRINIQQPEHEVNNNDGYQNENEENDESIHEIIELLPKTSIKNNSSKPKKDCIICLSEYQINDEITALPCTHIFHNSCIINWLKQNQTCPLCKYKISKSHFYP